MGPTRSLFGPKKRLLWREEGLCLVTALVVALKAVLGHIGAEELGELLSSWLLVCHEASLNGALSAPALQSQKNPLCLGDGLGKRGMLWPPCRAGMAYQILPASSAEGEHANRMALLFTLMSLRPRRP